jgi:predicted NACHT family NTPase
MKYNWKRYWCPREGEFILSSDGFLQDPGENHLFNPDLVTIEEISAIPCLILLGEPGIGKSSTMQVEKEAIDTKIHEKGDKALWIDLRSYGSEDRLLKDIFDNETFLSWKKGDQILYIFMDSLDECLLRISNLASLLIDKIKDYPIERLYLRIASRTADWPIFLEKEFNEIWGEDKVKIYELVPLTKNDVIKAAKANNLEANGFLKEIDYKNVSPLAIKPLTLRFLLNLYKKNYNLPYNQRDLYLRGCILLCEESNESRITSRLKGDFTAEQRLIVAGRIAAITLFANKYAIWTGANYGNMPKEDVHIRTLIGGMENVMELDFIVESFNINENAVYETLKTGLFSSRGPNRMGWVHKTYSEYLAAWYLLQHKLPLEKMLGLITHPLDSSGKLIPQLRGVSIWLANLMPDLTRYVAEREPLLLLKCDLVDTDDKFKEILVKTLFTLYDEKKLPYPSWQEQSLYGKVNHPRLAEQLSEYIFNNNYNIMSKIFAIRVARTCRLDMLQDGLAKIALDASQDIRLRKEAAHNIVDFGTDELKKKLRPLATGDAGADPDDELKGLGLEALWPNSIGPNELFCIITPPKNEHFSGNYSVFFYEIVPHIQPSDLPVALKWIETQQIEDDLSSFSYLADRIMLKALNYLNHLEVVDGLARAMISRHKSDEGHITRFIRDLEFKETLIKDDTKRRLLLSAMVPLFDNMSDLHVLIYSNPAMITNEDFGWIIEQIKTSKYIDHQHRWARLANYIIDKTKVDQISLILSVYHTNPGIHPEFAPLITPIALNSPKADKIRQRYFEMQELIEKREERKELLNPPPATRIANLLERCESGDYEAWWQLNLDLTLEPDSKRYGNELEPDLTSLPGWKEANVLTRDRIIQIAFDYISSQEPEISLWLGTNKIHRPATAGYKAFWLLFNERHHLFASISHDTWVKWAPAIIAYPSHLMNISSKDIRNELISRAYQHAPKSVIDALIILIDKNCAELGRVSIIGDLEDIWDGGLHQALLAKARDGKLNPECISDLLDFLLAHDSREARKYAESLFLSSYPGEVTRQQAIIIGGNLLIHLSDSSWTIIWQIIENNIEMGKEIILYAASKSYRQGKILEKSPKEDYLAKLFIWLYHNCPPSEYSIPLGGFTYTPEYQIAELRDSIIRHLKERGTLAAVEALAQIAKEFPQEDWFNWMVPEAQQIFLQQSWISNEPSYIRELILDQNKNTGVPNNIGMTKLEEIIYLLRGIEFNLTMQSLRSGSARQDLSRLKTNVESIKRMIESQGQNLAELGLAQEAAEQNILKELGEKKEIILLAVENFAQSFSDRENFEQIYKEIQALKQSKSRDQLELLADISSLIGFAFSLLAFG